MNIQKVGLRRRFNFKGGEGKGQITKPLLGKKAFDSFDSFLLPALAHRKQYRLGTEEPCQRTYEDSFYKISLGAADFKVK